MLCFCGDHVVKAGYTYVTTCCEKYLQSSCLSVTHIDNGLFIMLSYCFDAMSHSAVIGPVLLTYNFSLHITRCNNSGVENRGLLKHFYIPVEAAALFNNCIFLLSTDDFVPIHCTLSIFQRTLQRRWQ